MGYLVKQQKSSKYHFRFQVPKDVQDSIGKKVISKSTGTSDKTIAQRIAGAWVAEAWDMVERHRKLGNNPKHRTTDTEKRIKLLVAAHKDEWPEATDEEIYSVGLDALSTLTETGITSDPKEIEALAIATGVVVPLSDHLEAYQVFMRQTGKSEGTIRTWGSYLGNLFDKGEISKLNDLTPTNMLKAASRMSLSQSSQKGVASALKGYLKFLQNHVLLRPIPLPDMSFLITSSSKPEPKKPISPTIIKKLVCAGPAQRDESDLFLLGAFSGLRLIALTNWRWSDVDLDKGTVRIFTDKGQRLENGALLPLHSKSLQRLTQRHENECQDGSSSTEYVFNLGGDREAGLRSGFWSKRMGKFLRANGVDQTFHSLRHSVITRLADLGVEEQHRKALVRHSLGNDVHNRVYHHGYDVETLRPELEKLYW